MFPVSWSIWLSLSGQRPPLINRLTDGGTQAAWDRPPLINPLTDGGTQAAWDRPPLINPLTTLTDGGTLAAWDRPPLINTLTMLTDGGTLAAWDRPPLINRPFWKQNSKKKKVVYWFEMARNAIESDFWSSKMAQIGIPKWPRQPFCEFKKKNQSCVLIWNGEKCDRKRFSVIQNGRRQPFYKKNQSSVLIWNGEKCDQKWFSVIQNGRLQPFCEQNKKTRGLPAW